MLIQTLPRVKYPLHAVFLHDGIDTRSAKMTAVRWFSGRGRRLLVLLHFIKSFLSLELLLL